MGTRRRGGRALLVTAVAMALAVGCSSGGGPAGPRLEKTVLNVAVVPAVDSAGFFVALDRGLFRAHGLTVNFIAATSSDTAIARQLAGAYDITGGNYVSYIQAQQQGRANLDIFAEGSVMQPGHRASTRCRVRRLPRWPASRIRRWPSTLRTTSCSCSPRRS